MAKELESLNWVEDLLPQDHLRKKMFGGFAYYIDEKLCLLIFESTGNKTHHGEKYDYEIWNGCMFPADRENHDAILAKFPFLMPHPVLPKWLYIPQETEDFENLVEPVMKELRRKNPLFGTFPERLKKKSKKTSKKTDEKPEKYVPRPPAMFSDEPQDKRLETAKKISDLKNLGPESERAFYKAGIKTAPQAVKMGWKKVMKALCKSNPKNNHSIFAYAVIGALQNKIWNLISEEDKQEARAYMKQLREQQQPAKKRR